MLTASIPLWEVVVRVVAIYVALLVMVRISGKREIGSLGPMDFMAMLLLSETVSPALTAQDTSLSASLVAAATLIGLSSAVAFLSYRFRGFERVVEGTPSVVIEHGRVDVAVCRAERISDQELATALRKEGVTSADQVDLAVVEPTGRVTVIPLKSSS